MIVPIDPHDEAAAPGASEVLPTAHRIRAAARAMPYLTFDRFWLLLSLAELGRFAEAAAELHAEAIQLAEGTGYPLWIGNTYRAVGMLRLSQGDWAGARPLIEQAITVLRAGSVFGALARVFASSAWILAQVGEATEARKRLCAGEQLLEEQATQGNVSPMARSFHDLGRASLCLGQLDEARRLGDHALELAPSQPGVAAHALHLLGDIATHPNRFDAGGSEAHYRQALVLAEPRGMRPLVAHGHLGLGRLYRRTGKKPEAHEHLTTAAAMYRDMNMEFWLDKAHAEMCQLRGEDRAGSRSRFSVPGV